MIECLEEEKTLKIIAIDDQERDRKFMLKMLKKGFEGAEISIGDRPDILFNQLTFEKPQIVIVDWYYHGYDCSCLLPRLAKYKKGLICFYSAEDSASIKQQIKKCIGILPDNFRVFNKSNYRDMEDEIINYLADHF